jgi:hypothetical protein
MNPSETTPAPHDDGLEWLRAIRREMAAEANNDPAEMGRQLREREQTMKDRLFKTQRMLVPSKGQAGE